MNEYLRGLLLAQLAAAFAVLAAHGLGNPSAQLSADDSATIKVVISNLVDKEKIQFLIISDQSDAIELGPLLGDEPPFKLRGHSGKRRRIDESLLRNYSKRNSSSSPLPLQEALQSIEAKTRYVLAEEESLGELFVDGAQEGWRRFQSQFPEGTVLLSLSLPGYSADGRTAMVFAWCERGFLDSEGWIFMLKKVKSVWRIKWGEVVVLS